MPLRQPSMLTCRQSVVGSSRGLVPWPEYAQVDYTIVLCDGVWRRALPVQHFFPMTAGTGSQIDLPLDLPTDLAPSKIALTVNNPPGGHMSLSATGSRKTITVTAENGDVSDVFDRGVRGNGSGSGSYVFEPIPVGDSLLTVSGNFGIDLTMFDVSGGVPWRTLSSQTAS